MPRTWQNWGEQRCLCRCLTGSTARLYPSDGTTTGSENQVQRKQWVSPKTKTPVGSYFECCSQLVTLFWKAEETFGGEVSQAQGTSLWSLWFSHALSLLPGPLQCEQSSPVLPILPLMGWSTMPSHYGLLIPEIVEWWKSFPFSCSVVCFAAVQW